MKLPTLAILLIATACTLWSPTLQAQTERGQLVQRIVEAQGLQEIFDAQLGQQREAAQGYAAKLLEQFAAPTGGRPSAAVTAAFDRFIAKSMEIFSAREMVDAWVQSYGRDLSTQELEQVLAFYQSPVGRKEVAANKAAMLTFTSWMHQQSQARTEKLIADLMSELQAAGA